MTHFKRSAGTPYTVVTPSTELADLEQFLDNNIFALSACCVYAITTQLLILIPVTDHGRKFVLAVVTKQDLDVRTCSILKGSVH